VDVGIIHADMHDLQIMFDQKTKKLEAVIDWEGACYDTRVLDIGYTMERLSTNTNLLYNDLTVPLHELSHDKRKVQSFLENYNRARPLTSNHLKTMVDQLTIKFLNSNSRFLRKVFYGDPAPNPNNMLWAFRILSIERMEEIQKYL